MLRKTIISLTFTFIAFNTHAQFFRGIGVFAGGTMSSHKYVNSLAIDSFFFAHTSPAPSHRSAERFSWSAGIVAEFLKYDHFRWQTEFEYCNKGAVERPLIVPWPAERGSRTVNKYSNLQWNNFAKIIFNEGYRGTPYLMMGARLEYNLLRTITAYSAVAGSVKKITVTPDVAIGYEFVTYGKFKPFIEMHYNPDVLKLKVNNVTHTNRTFELRIGIMYRPKKSSIDDCNAPRYHGPSY
jgi:hypothetical protein